MEDFPESVSETSQSSKTLGKRKADETRLQRVLVNKGGRPKDPVWEDFDTGESDGKGHYGAQCDIPDNLRCYYLIKPRSYCKPISSEKVNEINKALLKAFVCARIAFSVIDNPFVRDLLHLLEPGWDLTTYTDMENNSIELEQDEDVLKSAQSNNNKLEIGLIVDFSHANFGGQGNAEELSRATQRSGNMEFDPVAIVEREFQFFNDDLL
ncbi:524_t:CDS:2 [Racocetra persica]|uniref:524_t:CDS:1 n=1 Tax=Racocetra persica TaxID=160502 RepID=A0ACA9NIG1_9GLOM|nr:524_t:CDS:2 [Racocetra persica]